MVSLTTIKNKSLSKSLGESYSNPAVEVGGKEFSPSIVFSGGTSGGTYGLTVSMALFYYFYYGFASSGGLVEEVGFSEVYVLLFEIFGYY